MSRPLKAGSSIADRIHRSVHTVLTFVKQIYAHFEVTSRGQLMALFVDRSVQRAVEREAAGQSVT